jgi:hypothetical protein
MESSVSPPIQAVSRNIHTAVGGVWWSAAGKPACTLTCVIILGGREDESARTEIDGANIIQCSTAVPWAPTRGRGTLFIN